MNCPNCNEIVPDTNYKCPHCRKALQPVKEPSEFRKEHTPQSSFNINILIIVIIVIGLAGIIYTTIFKGSGEEIKPDNSPSSPFIRPRTTEKQRPAVPANRFKEMAENNGEGQSFGEAETQTEPEPETGLENPDTPADSDTGSDIETDTALDSDDGGIDGGNGDAPEGTVINLADPGEEVYIEDFVQGGRITVFDFYSDYCPPCRQFSPWLLELDNRRDDIVVFKVDINRQGVSGIDWGSPVIKQYNIRRLPYFMIYDSSGTRTHDGGAATTYVVGLLQGEGILK